MSIFTRHDVSRRAFLERATLLGIAGAAMPFVMNLAAIGEAAAATAPDYKALVCLFMYGGNDDANTLVPYDQPRYDLYAKLRQSVALGRDSLAPTVLMPSATLVGGGQYALHPALAPLLPIWNSGHLAAVLNVGTLVQPTTKAQYVARSAAVPPKLFSHNDQASYWLAAAPEGAASGWGGRIGDLLQSGNGNATLTCINPGDNTVFLAGKTAVQYVLTTGGPVPLNNGSSSVFGSNTVGNTLKSFLSAPRVHLIENEHTRIGKRALETSATVVAALAKAPVLQTQFPENQLAHQLRTVAQLIASSADVGAKRQVFFVSMSGCDTHGNLLGAHADLMTMLGNALRAFHDATVELRVADRVTAFTASDFGRTMTTNGGGSDHGWGSMHFVMGGAVNGQQFYGKPPVIADNGSDDVGQGRLLPTMSVDQYAATLATWFGVSAGDMRTVLPNIGNYTTQNMGFV